MRERHGKREREKERALDRKSIFKIATTSERRKYRDSPKNQPDHKIYPVMLKQLFLREMFDFRIFYLFCRF